MKLLNLMTLYQNSLVSKGYVFNVFYLIFSSVMGVWVSSLGTNHVLANGSHKSGFSNFVGLVSSRMSFWFYFLKREVFCSVLSRECE